VPELFIRHMDDSRTIVKLIPGGWSSWDHTADGLVLRWGNELGRRKVFPWATVKSYMTIPDGDNA
jgi:hypothetical protein